MEQTERALRKARAAVWKLNENGLENGAPVGLFRSYLQPVPGREALRFLSNDHPIPDDS